MKLNHAIKKIAAIGAGAMLLGVSAAAVAAANTTNDLSTYPAPFIQNGEFAGNIVLGSTAQTIDVLGAVSIATSLQASAVTKTPVNLPGQQSQTVLQDSVAIKSGSDNLYYGANLDSVKASLTGADLSMLKTSSFTDTNGNNYDIQFRITPPNANVTFSSNGNVVNSNSDPTYYLDFSKGATWSLNMNFPTAVNLSDLGGQDITVLGQTYTVGQGSETSNSAKTLTLVKEGAKTTVQAGSPQTVTVDGQDVKLSVVGANTNTGTATVSVNGEAKTVTKGNFYTIGGQRVYIDDVFVVDIPTQVASVRFFVGAQKIILKDGNPVRTDSNGNEKDVQGTNVAFSGGGTSDVSQITITYTPNDQDPTQAPNVNSDTQGLLENSTYVDPVFHQIKWAFTDIVPPPMGSSKELIQLYPGSDDEFWLKATNKNGQEYNVDLFKVLSGSADLAYGTTANQTYVFGPNYYGKMANGSTSTTQFERLAKRNRFILSSGTTATGGSEYSRIMEVSSVDNHSSNELLRLRDDSSGGSTTEFTPSITVNESNLPTGYRDLNANGVYTDTYKAGTFTYDGYDYGYVILDGNSVLLVDPSTLSATPVTTLTPISTSNKFITQNGAMLTLPTSNIGAYGSSQNITLTEDTKFNNGNPSAADAGQLNFSVQFYNTTDNQLRVGSVGYGKLWSGLVQLQSNNKMQQAVTVYGTVLQRNKDSTGGNVDIYYPADQAFYNVFVGPASAGTTTAGSEGSVTTEAVNAINVGAAILDIDAAGLVGSHNLIVVGGPCVNSVASQLLGKPNDCKTGFTQGSAMIKEFQNPNGTVSLLVAGYSGQDSLLASHVLANYAQYQGQLVGNEVVVSGTTLQNVAISAPVMTQQDNSTPSNSSNSTA